jgi:hypothetical protein
MRFAQENNSIKKLFQIENPTLADYHELRQYCTSYHISDPCCWDITLFTDQPAGEYYQAVKATRLELLSAQTRDFTD